MCIKIKEKGFTIIECLIVLFLVSSLSIASLGSINSLSKKVKTVDSNSIIEQLQFYFAKMLNTCDANSVAIKNGQILTYTYPILSVYTVGSQIANGEKVSDDRMDYGMIKTVYLDPVFSKIEGLENGTYYYEPANNFTSNYSSTTNVINYVCDLGTINVYLNLRKTGSGAFQKAWFTKVEYIDKSDLIRSFGF